MANLIAFHGKTEVQATILNRVQAHYTLDEIIQGSYWQNGKGCLVGCSIHGSDHARFETEAGVPEPIAYLADAIFEGLRPHEAKDFVPAFWKAIPFGADLSLVSLKFGLWSLTDEKWGLNQYILKAGDEKLIAATEKIIDFYTRTIAGQEVSVEELESFDLADLTYLADRADLAYLADLTYLADRADLAYLADLTYLAYLAYRAYLADRADLAYRAYRADLTYRAYLAYLADLAYYWVAARDQLLKLLSEAPIPAITGEVV